MSHRRFWPPVWLCTIRDALIGIDHKLERVLDRQSTIIAALTRLENKETIMATDLTALKDSVAAIKGTEASTRELVTQVAALVAAQTAKIQQLIDAGTIDPAELQAAVDDLNATTTSLGQDKDALAAAVATNPVP